jgi:hypothetical protein
VQDAERTVDVSPQHIPSEGLLKSIADVERLRKSGEVYGGAYRARLKRLPADLAENEPAFKAPG